MNISQTPRYGATRMLAGIAINAALAIVVNTAQQVAASYVQEQLERRKEARLAARKTTVGFRG